MSVASSEKNEESEKAYLKALGRVSRREQSTLDLRRYLSRKSFSEPAIEWAIQRLLELGYLNDERYAKALTRSLLQRGKGPRYIQQKLHEKGVHLKPDEIAAETQESLGRSDLERAQEIVQRRYPTAPEDIQEANRAYQALLRRGFSFEIARKAARSKS